jgi:hypothetical protein
MLDDQVRTYGDSVVFYSGKLNIPERTEKKMIPYEEKDNPRELNQFVEMVKPREAGKVDLTTIVTLSLGLPFVLATKEIIINYVATIAPEINNLIISLGH